MLKYSTYRSIYDEAQEDNNSAGYQFTDEGISKIKEGIHSFAEGICKLILQGSIYKFVLVILLVVSGFTVVGNVFADTMPVHNQEKRIVVERGDTLWSIARQNKPADMKTAVYIEGIKISSGLGSSEIQAGDVITLPVY